MVNSNFKRCDLGHYYPASKSSCPHCDNSSDSQTSNINTSQKNIAMENNDKTQIITGGKTNSGSTDNKQTEIVNKPTSIPDSGDKTVIAGGNSTKATKRKLVGWLVSYTLDENGIDFKLYEGKNTIGRSADNDIKLFQDSQISSEHAIILKRAENFYVQDQMSSNPSFRNGEEIMPGSTEKLEDGDVLKFGDNEFKFRKI